MTPIGPLAIDDVLPPIGRRVERATVVVAHLAVMVLIASFPHSHDDRTSSASMAAVVTTVVVDAAPALESSTAASTSPMPPDEAVGVAAREEAPAVRSEPTAADASPPFDRPSLADEVPPSTEPVTEVVSTPLAEASRTLTHTPADPAPPVLHPRRPAAPKRHTHSVEAGSVRSDVPRPRRTDGAAQRVAGLSPARTGAPAGEGGGASVASEPSRAAYAARVAAEINRHKRYPDAARMAGRSGFVGVRFHVDAAGRIAGWNMSRSSGDAAIDAAVAHMFAVAHPPPPPGGRFDGSIVIRFELN